MPAACASPPSPPCSSATAFAGWRPPTLVAHLRAQRHTQLKEPDKRLAVLLAQAGPRCSGHRLLQGAGPVVTATLLAEATDAIERRDLNALRARCGTAPVTCPVRQDALVSMRCACNELLRDACFAFARNAVVHDPWAKELYTGMRERDLWLRTMVAIGRSLPLAVPTGTPHQRRVSTG